LADKYKPLFPELISLPAGKSLLFHCTAGKDRTGIGAALVLAALGVPKKEILNDYTATDYYRQDENKRMAGMMAERMHVSEKVANNMLAARASYLNAFFTAIDHNFGSVDSFLKGPLGLDKVKLAKLRSMYLQ